MRHDIRVGLRLLLRDRTFALTTGLTLAICIAANLALFSIVDHVLLKPLPVPHSERIVLMGNTYPNAGAPNGTNSSVPDYYDRQRETDVFDEQAMYRPASVSLDQDGTPTRVQMLYVTPSFFRLVDSIPLFGRAFTEAEGEPGNDTAVILSYGLWQKQFGGDRAAVGRQLRINGRQMIVVGVMSAGFHWIAPDVVGWLPLAFPPAQKADSRRHGNSWNHVGRLKAGVSVEQAQAEIDLLNARNLERFPEYRQLLINTGFRTVVI
ncbi:MAG: ABC transporter permease, partial [Vicinamibacterales bacterium]